MQEGVGRNRSVVTEFILGIMEDVLELDMDCAAYNIHPSKIGFSINMD